MFWCAPTTHRWSLISTAKEVCACAPCTGWCAISLSGLNMEVDVLLRQGQRPGEWMLHPNVVKKIWRVVGQAQVDLFATQETALCPHWYSLVHPAPLGLDAKVQMWPRLRLYTFPPIALLPGVLARSVPGRGQSTSGSIVLAGPSMVLGPDFSPWWLSIGDSRQEGSPLTGRGLSPSPRVMVAGVWPLRGRSS